MEDLLTNLFDHLIAFVAALPGQLIDLAGGTTPALLFLGIAAAGLILVTVAVRRLKAMDRS